MSLTSPAVFLSRLFLVGRDINLEWDKNFELSGGRDKVEFYKVDKVEKVDVGFKVEIEDRALCWQILTTTLRSTLRILNVDLKVVVKIRRHRAWLSMSTLRPKSISVDIKHNFHVDLLNFDLNNSTREFVMASLLY